MSDELANLGEDFARDARTYLSSVTEVASGASPDTAIPVLLLAVSQVLVAGARLGAITDVVPDERFETDPGPDTDVDQVLGGLVSLFDGLDGYVHVVDPLVSAEVATGSLSNDLVDVAAALAHGLQHFESGRVSEALWWWQFSYLSSWGDSATRALRVLQAVLGHIRLDADDDAVAEAEFDALHP
jgi:Domain of unknown function (DUF5063)